MSWCVLGLASEPQEAFKGPTCDSLRKLAASIIRRPIWQVHTFAAPMEITRENLMKLKDFVKIICFIKRGEIVGKNVSTENDASSVTCPRFVTLSPCLWPLSYCVTL